MRQVPQVFEPTGQNYRFLPSSDRVRIFQGLYKHLIYIINFIEPNLAKVGVEGSNPFARSSFLS